MPQSFIQIVSQSSETFGSVCGAAGGGGLEGLWIAACRVGRGWFGINSLQSLLGQDYPCRMP